MPNDLSKDDMFETDCPDENVENSSKTMEQRHLCHHCYPLWKLLGREFQMNSRRSSQV